MTSPTASVVVRDAVVDDMAAVRDIYNATIPTTTVAWTEVVQSLENRLAWFDRQVASGHITLVAEIAGRVVGFAAYDDFRGAGKWPGYRYTAEHTVHVAGDVWGRGVGRALITELLDRAAANGILVMVGAIDAENRESVAFHERLGFEIVGRMPQVGTKFGRWLDLLLVQRRLDDRDPADR